MIIIFNNLITVTASNYPIITPRRAVKMVMNNQKLRQQLEEAQNTNARLMEDVQQLTCGWNESRQKLQKREALWQENFEHESGRSQKLHHLSLSIIKKDALVIKNEMDSLQQNIQR